MGKSAETIAWYKENGICLHCGQRHVKPGCQMCHECLANKNDATKIWYHNLSDEAKKARHAKNYGSQRKTEQRRFEQGLCFRCGKRPPILHTRYGQCAVCRAKSREQQRRKRIRNGTVPRDERVKGVFCYRCGKPITKDKYCPECYGIVVKQMEHARQFRAKENGWHLYKLIFGKIERGE